MKIIQNRKIYFTISGLLIAASIFAIAILGLRQGIDFTGGALLEITVAAEVKTSAGEIQAFLTRGESPVLPSVQVQSTGAKGFILRFKEVNQTEHQAILAALRSSLSISAEESVQIPPSDQGDSTRVSPPVRRGGGVGGEGDKPAATIQGIDENGDPVELQVERLAEPNPSFSPPLQGGAGVVVEERFESIGPVIGRELRERSVYAVVFVMAAIILYIAWAFRKVSTPVSSWKYGLTAIIALAHDVIIPAGVFAVLGYFLGVEIDILFVTALLTIIGFSVNDTIVVFDRTRENLARAHYHGDFEEIVNNSVNQSIRRSLFTSLTTFLVLFAIYLFGGASIKYFVLALMIGVLVGTYSSIFLASPILVEWEHRSRRRQ